MSYIATLQAALTEATALNAGQQHDAAASVLRTAIAAAPPAGNEPESELLAIADLVRHCGREADRQERRSALLVAYLRY